MRALIKSSIILALLAISVYLYWSQSQDFFAPPKPEALIAPVDSAAKAKIDEELEYLVVKRRWAEVEKLLHAEKTPGPVAAEVSNSASPDVIAAIGAQRPAEPSAGLQVVTPTQDEICRRDEERLERLRNSPSSEEAERFANELGCERLRPQHGKLDFSRRHHLVPLERGSSLRSCGPSWIRLSGDSGGALFPVLYQKNIVPKKPNIRRKVLRWVSGVAGTDT